VVSTLSALYNDLNESIPKHLSMTSVLDLFCGVGGLSHGFRLEGFEIAAGVDIDERFRYGYEENNDAPFLRRDVAAMTAKDVDALFGPADLTVLMGCAPCQPFSSYNQKNINPEWQLVEYFGCLICEALPDVVSMENVPRLLTFKSGQVFRRFVKVLESSGYNVSWKVVFAPDYGVPQRRSRLVLLASRLGPIEMVPPTHNSMTYRTVRDLIADLPALEAGNVDPYDQLHRSSGLTEKNRRRIESAKPGGTWHDWETDLVTACHKVPTGKGYVSVYGRMPWDEPAPTITTQFHGFGNGRFGHPVQNRAISLREGALLQSFPLEYKFVAPADPIHFSTVGRMIGNAVPVLLARAIARSIRHHIEKV
jgi:DNA (cytosine-5)-methyltransferase 1